MADLSVRFAQAQEDVKKLAAEPDNDTKLKLYALYKQATVGDVSGERPGGFDFVRRAKFDAWEQVKGTAADDAMREYIELVTRLKR